MLGYVSCLFTTHETTQCHARRRVKDCFEEGSVLSPIGKIEDACKMATPPATVSHEWVDNVMCVYVDGKRIKIRMRMAKRGMYI